MNNQTLPLIWGAMLSAIGVYAAAGAIVAPAPADSFDPVLPLLLAVVSLSMVGMAIVAGRFVPEYTTVVIIRCAMAESVALFGFVLLFIGGGWSVALPYFATAVLFMLAVVPTVRGRQRFDDAKARRQRVS